MNRTLDCSRVFMDTYFMSFIGRSTNRNIILAFSLRKWQLSSLNVREAKDAALKEHNKTFIIILTYSEDQFINTGQQEKNLYFF